MFKAGVYRVIDEKQLSLGLAKIRGTFFGAPLKKRVYSRLGSSYFGNHFIFLLLKPRKEYEVVIRPAGGTSLGLGVQGLGSIEFRS